mmetsp:Transcript_18054/g.59296  ORF Transcript_18054/g.59296 Transcript_18054/m.59296 type:complete len:201 (+) Transcript_18054:714-1316(+)
MTRLPASQSLSKFLTCPHSLHFIFHVLAPSSHHSSPHPCTCRACPTLFRWIFAPATPYSPAVPSSVMTASGLRSLASFFLSTDSVAFVFLFLSYCAFFLLRLSSSSPSSPPNRAYDTSLSCARRYSFMSFQPSFLGFFRVMYPRRAKSASCSRYSSFAAVLVISLYASSDAMHALQTEMPNASLNCKFVELSPHSKHVSG